MNRGHGQGEALFPTAGKDRGALIAARAQLEPLEGLLDTPPPCLPVEPEDLRGELQVLDHGQVVVERKALGHVPDLGAQALGFDGELAAQHARVSRGRSQETDEQSNQRRLAGAVGPEKPEHLAAADGEIDPVDRDQRAERAAQLPGLDDRLTGQSDAFPRFGRISLTVAGTPGRRSAGASARITRAR